MPRALRIRPGAALVVFLALFVLLSCLPGPAAAQDREVIERFDSAVEVRADGSMQVTETIKVLALGRQIKRGIYRDFPTTYEDDHGRTVRVPFDVKEVLRDGNPEPHHAEGMANGVRLYLGDKDVFLRPGEYTYTIVYETDRQIGFFEDHDELYWNVTGNDWDFPILRATGSVRLPGAAQPTMRDAWTGHQGQQGGDFLATNIRGVTVFKTTRPLEPGEGLTIAVGFDKGLVAPPGFLETHNGLVWGVGILGLVLAYYLFAWGRVGRDPRGRAIIPLFEPPKGLSPAGCRHIARMGWDNTCFAAAVISCAVKGALTIEEPKRRKYALKKGPDQGEAELPPDEKALADAIFKDWDGLVLEKSNHVRVASVRSALKTALQKRYGAKYYKRNAAWLLPGVVASLAGMVVLAMYDPVAGAEQMVAVMMAIFALFWSVAVGSLWSTVRNAWRGGRILTSLPVIIVAALFTLPLFGMVGGLIFMLSYVFYGATSANPFEVMADEAALSEHDIYSK